MVTLMRAAHTALGGGRGAQEPRAAQQKCRDARSASGAGAWAGAARNFFTILYTYDIHIVILIDSAGSEHQRKPGVFR